MKLQDRNLSIDMQGEDVKLLQKELQRLGFSIKDKEGIFGNSVYQAVLEFQKQHGLGSTGEVDETTAKVINVMVDALGTIDQPAKFVVKGQIRQTDGSPLAGVPVRAFDKDLRREELLGEAVADKYGRYEIMYTAEQFHRAEKKNADLYIRVYKEGDQVIASSSIIFNAQPVETIDLSVDGEYHELSEYEKLIAEITPLLEGIPIAELVEDEKHRDITFISGETGQDFQHIEFLIEAHKLAKQTDLQPDVFYGLFRQNLPTSLSALLSQNHDVLHRALEASLRDNIIPFRLSEWQGAILNRLHELAVEEVLKPADESKRASFGNLLSIVLPDREKQKVLADAFVTHQGTGEEFWKEIHGFSQDEINQIQVILELGVFTQYHIPLMHELLQKRPEEEIASIQYLANLDEDGWLELANKHGAPPDTSGETNTEKIKNYATMLAHAIEDSFPTAVIASRISQGKFGFDASLRTNLDTFFKKNPKFAFGDTVKPANIYLESDEINLNGVANPHVTKSTLLQIDRIYKLTSRVTEINTLIRDGFHSAYSIAHMRENDFISRYTEPFGEARARDIYAKGRQVHDTALLFYIKHHKGLNKPEPYVISGALEAFEMLKISPEWRTLFGTLDLCDCKHCMSVYSPAAYLVDILSFLAKGTIINGRTPLQILLDRRPDIAEIELTCENINIKLPYIDLVNEVLEYPIEPVVPQIIPNPTGRNMISDLDKCILPTEVKNAIAGITSPSSELAIVKVSNPGKEWRIADGARRWMIRYSPDSMEIKIGNQSPLHIDISPGSNAMTEMDHAQLPIEVKSAIAKYPYLPPANFIISVLRIGIRWQITYSLEAMISIIVRQPISFFTISAGNQQLATFPILYPFVPSMIAELDQGRLPVALEERLRIPANIAITVINAGAQWRITLNEQAIVELIPGKLIVSFLSLQTSGTPEELKANPEQINTKAYDKLSNAVYPWTLPFNLWLEEARVYLNHIGVHRHELMEKMFRGSLVDALLSSVIVNEHLGISELEAGIIVGRVTHDSRPIPIRGDPDRPWDFWGILQNAEIPDPAGGRTPIIGKWDAVLKRVDVFLQRSGLNYGELLELLGTYFINPITTGSTRKLSLVSIDTIDMATCNLSKLEIKGLDKPTLGRIHRFVRLWHRLGWTMRDLDKAILLIQPKNANGELDISNAFLRYLSHAKRLHAKLNVPLLTILSWWSEKIDTARYIDHLAEGQPEVLSLYDQLFQNKTVVTPANEIFKLNSTRDELKYLTSGASAQKLSAHSAVITAGLGISATDLALLLSITAKELKMVLDIDDAKLAAFVGTTEAELTSRTNYPDIPAHDTLRLWTISLLYRLSSFSKALKLPIVDFLTVLKLMATNPFARSMNTLQFVDNVSKVQDSKFTIAELNYLLRHEFLLSSVIAPTDENISLVLDEIRSGLQKIAAENTFRDDLDDPNGRTTDQRGELTKKKLALLNWDNELIKQVTAAFNDDITYETDLSALPAGIVLPNDTGIYETDLLLNALPNRYKFPDGLQEVVVHDRSTGKLRVLRKLTYLEWKLLLDDASQNGYYDYGRAVQTLIEQQDGLKGRISYDEDAEKLRFTGTMNLLRYAKLKSMSNDADYQEAIDTLFTAPRDFILRHMHTFSLQRFSVALAALPASVKLPNALKNKIYYDETEKRLYSIGMMSKTERDQLLNLSSNPRDTYHEQYLIGINTLYYAPNLRPSASDFSAQLWQLPANIQLPGSLSNQIHYDSTEHMLRFNGTMTLTKQQTLLGLSDNLAYQEAIQALFFAPNVSSPLRQEDFLTHVEISLFFDTTIDTQGNPITPEYRFNIVLKKLLPYLRTSLSEQFVKHKIGEALQLESRVVEQLLSEFLRSPADPEPDPTLKRKALAEFLDLTC